MLFQDEENKKSLYNNTKAFHEGSFDDLCFKVSFTEIVFLQERNIHDNDTYHDLEITDNP